MALVPLPYLSWQQPSPHADRVCLRDDRVELTYSGVARRVDAIAGHLTAAGVRTGDVVAVMLPNRVELLLSIMAAWRIGATATPVNPAFTAVEATHQIRDAQAVLLVRERRGLDLGIPALEVDTLGVRGGSALPDPAAIPDDLALLVYTSGSTGRPKGVMLTHANLAAMAASVATALVLTREDHCLLTLPLFHVNALVISWLAPVSVGAQVTVLTRFEPTRFLESLSLHQATYFSAVPTIYARLAELSESSVAPPDLSSVRFAVCGAAPVSLELLHRFERRYGFPVIEGYGLTEGTCASTLNPLHGPRKPGTVGIALPGQEVRTMAPDGSFTVPGVPGEVVIKGPNVMRGYLHQPAATAEAIVDGWLHTGDVGLFDSGGYLTLVDRMKDMIIRGGENIYPKEIETVLGRHGSVVESAVVGAPHSLYGEVPVAYVVTYAGTEVSVDELLDLCRASLTKVKLPVAIHVVDHLPRNPVGKIDKPALRRREAISSNTGG